MSRFPSEDSRPRLDPFSELVGRCAAAFRARLKGPGGYYNIGNAVALFTGVALHSPASNAARELAWGTAIDYLAGSASALALTVATLVFFWSGEVYHRAWANRLTPDPDGNRRGDFLSGVGAVALGFGLLMLNQPVLAAFSGLLHAVGKFGSAQHEPGAASRLDPWRTAVLLSRAPAILAALIGLYAGVTLVLVGADYAVVAAPAALLVSYLLWAKADLLLMRKPAPAEPASAPGAELPARSHS